MNLREAMKSEDGAETKMRELCALNLDPRVPREKRERIRDLIRALRESLSDDGGEQSFKKLQVFFQESINGL